jgi:adenosine deaminase
VPTDAFIATVRALPKAELHVHLEGCLEADLLFALAARNDVALPWASVDELRRAYRFDDLQSFLALYFAGCRVLCRERDFYDVTRAYLSRAHADGVVRAETFLGPQSFTERGIPIDDVLGGIWRAMEDAEADDGISCGLLVSAHRHRSEADAFALLESVLPWADRIAGFGLGGAEVGNPPSKFQAYFDELHRLGFNTTAHAGEEGPADYVRAAFELLGVDRIDHGLSSLDDPALVDELVAAATPLTVCPVSNVKLKVVSAIATHPLPAMLAAGLNVTLNSDDPAYFEGYLLDTYLQCAGAFGLSVDVVAQLAANSIAASFMPAAAKQRHLAHIAQLTGLVTP